MKYWILYPLLFLLNCSTIPKDGYRIPEFESVQASYIDSSAASIIVYKEGSNFRIVPILNDSILSNQDFFELLTAYINTHRRPPEPRRKKEKTL